MGLLFIQVTDAHRPGSGKEKNMEEYEGKSCARTKCCAVTCHQGKGLEGEKLELQVSATP
jgi:hypothetical protein